MILPALLFILGCVVQVPVAALAETHVFGAVWGYLAGHGLMTLAMGLAWARCKTSPYTCKRFFSRPATAMLLVSVVGRVILLAVPPWNTHDVSRYLWDGAVALQGQDPYCVTPQTSGPPFDDLRKKWYVAPEHRRYPTLYPPLALAAFAWSANSPEGAKTAALRWRYLAAAAEGLALLAAALAGWSPRRFALLAYSPLLALETGVGAHLDALVSSCVILGLALISVRRCSQAGKLRQGAGGVLLGFGVLLKLTPLPLMWPLWLGRWRTVAAVGVATVGLGYATAIVGFDLHPWGSTGTFAVKWRFGAPLSLLTDALPAWAGWCMRVGVVLLGAYGSALLALRRRPRPESPCQTASKHTPCPTEGPLVPAAASLMLGAVMLASPVVFPWYLTTLTAVLAFNCHCDQNTADTDNLHPPKTLLPSWAIAAQRALWAWSLMAPLTYEVVPIFERTGVWQPAAWPMWLTVVSMLGAAASVPLRRGCATSAAA